MNPKTITIYDHVTKRSILYIIRGDRGERDRDEWFEIEEEVGVGLHPLEQQYSNVTSTEGA